MYNVMYICIYASENRILFDVLFRQSILYFLLLKICRFKSYINTWITWQRRGED